jgi:hypothetical protein
MPYLPYYLWIILINLAHYHGIVIDNCRFMSTFYQTYPNIFEVNHNEKSLTVRALYALANQSFTSINQPLSMGIIYRFADTYLVPVPLLFECTQQRQILAPHDCQLTMIDKRVRLSIVIIV